MPEVLRDIIARNRAGAPVAIASVCSAQPDVLRASMRMAARLGRPLVVEATSNQVNQEGGYMGLQPSDYVGYVHDLADEAGLDRAALTLGGDHLGTQVWRAGPAEAAMAQATRLVRAYAAAGFRKIHLDCAEGCAGEPAQLDDARIASRSARLARACAEVAEDLLFVIGTEVPPPGGARLDAAGDIAATTPKAAQATLAAHDAAFGDLAPLIGGLVVQPGVEFSPTAVHPLPMDRDPGLRAAIADRPGLCLEAHSTDYQDPPVFARLAELGFAFLKVGPALTHAYRAALYALDQLRDPPGELRAAMETEMLAAPGHWQSHYAGDDAALYAQRHGALADRIRYYWPRPGAQAAVAALFAELAGPVPDARLRAALPGPTLDRFEALPGPWPQRVIDAHIETALAPYFLGAAA